MLLGRIIENYFEIPPVCFFWIVHIKTSHIQSKRKAAINWLNKKTLGWEELVCVTANPDGAFFRFYLFLLVFTNKSIERAITELWEFWFGWFSCRRRLFLRETALWWHLAPPWDGGQDTISQWLPKQIIVRQPTVTQFS